MGPLFLLGQTCAKGKFRAAGWKGGCLQECGVVSRAKGSRGGLPLPRQIGEWVPAAVGGFRSAGVGAVLDSLGFLGIGRNCWMGFFIFP